MTKQKPAQKKIKRDQSLDLLRGIAVILMIITHVNGIFYRGDLALLNGITWWGATVCFTMFLFVSASVTGIKFELGKMDREKAAKRLLMFLLVYFVTAFLLVALRFGLDTAFDQILQILLFYEVPEFIEFLLAFILYGFVALLVPTNYRKKITQPHFLIPLTIVVFLLGKAIYMVETESEVLITIKFLLTGHKEMHSFGILAYFPVYALGLWWGGNSVRLKGRDKTLTNKVFLATFLLYLVLIITGISKGNRWPPSVTFLLYGVWFSFLILTFSDWLINLKYFGRSVIFVGVNAFYYYVIHILLLYVIAFATGWSTFNEVLTVFVSIFTIFTTTIAVYLKKAYEIAFNSNNTH